MATVRSHHLPCWTQYLPYRYCTLRSQPNHFLFASVPYSARAASVQREPRACSASRERAARAARVKHELRARSASCEHAARAARAKPELQACSASREGEARAHLLPRPGRTRLPRPLGYTRLPRPVRVRSWGGWVRNGIKVYNLYYWLP